MGCYVNSRVFNPNVHTKIYPTGKVMMYQRSCPSIVFWLLQSSLSFCVPTHWVSVLGRRSAILHDNMATLRVWMNQCVRNLNLLHSFNHSEYVNQLDNQMHQLNQPRVISTFITSKGHKIIWNLIFIYCTWKKTFFSITISTN